jgi:hypothetical protein
MNPTRLYIVDEAGTGAYFNSDLTPDVLQMNLDAWAAQSHTKLELDSKDPSNIWVLGTPNLPAYWIGFRIVTPSPLAAAIILQMWKETKARR